MEQKLTIAEQVWFKELNNYADKYNFATTGDFEDYREQYENGDSAYEVIIEEIRACN